MADLNREIYDPIEQWRYWLYRAFLRVRSKTSKTRLGLIWEPLSFLLVVAILTLVWSVIFRRKTFEEFFPYLMGGFLVWQLIHSSLSTGLKCLQKHAGDIAMSRRPMLSYVMEDLTVNLISFVITLPAVLIILVVLGYPSITGVLSFLVGIVFILLSAIGFALTVGVGAFFSRDLLQVIKAMLRFSFLVTPIIWYVERLGAYKAWIWLNPFYSYLSICRDGLLGQPAQPLAFLIAGSVTVVLLGVAFLVVSSNLDRIRYRAFAS